MHIEKVLVEARAKQFVEYRRAYRSRVIARETEREREVDRRGRESCSWGGVDGKSSLC